MKPTHTYRIRKWMPERFGQPCQLLACGKRNAVLIEFADGVRVVTVRWFLRRLQGEA
jgi:hypothetical protein